MQATHQYFMWLIKYTKISSTFGWKEKALQKSFANFALRSLLLGLNRRLLLHLPRESKPLLNRADGTRVYAINHDTLCKEILTQKEQEPFWRV